MNTVLHKQLNQLRVIALIEENDKLDLSDGLTIQDKSWFGWFRRQQWWGSRVNSKEETVKFLQDFYVSVYEIVDQQLILGVENASDQNLPKILDIAVSFAEKLKLSLAGLENLSKTYRMHPKQTAEIRGIIDDYAKPALVNLTKHIPENYKTKILIDNNNLLE